MTHQKKKTKSFDKKPGRLAHALRLKKKDKLKRLNKH